MNHKTSERHSSFTPMTSGNSKAWQPSVGIQNVERTRCIREDTHDPVSKGQHISKGQHSVDLLSSWNLIPLETSGRRVAKPSSTGTPPRPCSVAIGLLHGLLRLLLLEAQGCWEAQMPGKLQAQNNSTASIRIFAHYDAVQERVQALIEVVDVTRRLVARHQKKQVGSALLIQGVPLKVELGEFGQRNKVRS